MMLMKSEESSGKLLRAWRDADAAALSKQAPLQAQPFSSAEVRCCPWKASLPCFAATLAQQQLELSWESPH